MANGFAKNLADAAPEASDFGVGEIAGLAQRMKTSAPEALVGVDIAEATQNALIEQEGFEAGGVRAESAAESGLGKLERIGA